MIHDHNRPQRTTPRTYSEPLSKRGLFGVRWQGLAVEVVRLSTGALVWHADSTTEAGLKAKFKKQKALLLRLEETYDIGHTPKLRQWEGAEQ